MTSRRSDAATEAAIACIHAGLMSPTEAADAFGLSQSALWKRCRSIGFNPTERREARLRRLARIATLRKWRLPDNWR